MTRKIASLAILAVVCTALAFGQVSMTSTTLSAALNATATRFAVASATGISAPSNPVSAGAIGTSGGSSYILLFVDREAMAVDGVNGTTVTVKRGFAGTVQTAHASGAKVWVGPAGYYAQQDPSGTCTATALTVLPRVVTTTGNVFNCPTSGPSTGTWTKRSVSESFLYSQVANVSSTGSGNVVTYTLPAGTLATDGDFLRIRAWGTSVNSPVLKLFFGATAIQNAEEHTQFGTPWIMQCEVVRQSATTQRASCSITEGNNVLFKANVSSPGETLSGNIVIKTSQLGGSAADVVQQGFTVEVVRQ